MTLLTAILDSIRVTAVNDVEHDELIDIYNWQNLVN
jgi:hypothetical protein